jgi:predicted phage terminase large subunit-like protein
MQLPEINTVTSRTDVLEAIGKNPYGLLQHDGVTRLSLHEFLRVFWDEVAETDFKDNWHLSYLCEQLEEIAFRVARNEPCEKDLIINIPPGTTKTIVCSIMFPAWCWAMGWYWMRFITASYSATLALESAEKSRDMIRSDKFKALYPTLTIKDDKDTKSNFRIAKFTEKGRLRFGGNRFSTSVGGTLTGFHAHIIIIDDPLNPEQAASEKELGNCNRWMEQTLPTRKVDKEVSATVLVMQRLHQSDPTGRALERKPDAINHICLPGQIKDYGQYLKPESARKYYVDGLLDPTRLGPHALQKLLEDLGQYGFAGQIGQNPAPPGGGMFKVDRMPVMDILEERQILKTFRYWDKAASEDAGAYTCGVKMSQLRDKRFLIHDVIRGQWSPDVREKVIRSTAEVDGSKVRIYIEQEPGSGGKESVEASIKNLAGFAAYADRPTGDKIRRADPFSVQVNISNVSLLRGDWNQAFKDELEIFPFGTYKDQVDAASGAFNLLAAKKQVRVIR